MDDNLPSPLIVRDGGGREISGSLQNPAYSPDGKRLVLTRFRDGYNRGISDLVVADADGSHAQIIGRGVNMPGLATWVGDAIVATNAQDGDRPWKYSYDPIERKWTGRRISNSALWEPTQSPDGRYVVAQTPNPGRLIVLSTDPDYRPLTKQITGGPGQFQGDARQPVWGPASYDAAKKKWVSRVVFQSSAGGVYTVDPDNPSDYRRVESYFERANGTKAPLSCTDPSFASGGGSIVASCHFAGMDGSDSAFVFPTAGGAARHLGPWDHYVGAIGANPADPWAIAAESSKGDPDGGRTGLITARSSSMPTPPQSSDSLPVIPTPVPAPIPASAPAPARSAIASPPPFVYYSSPRPLSLSRRRELVRLYGAGTTIGVDSGGDDADLKILRSILVDKNPDGPTDPGGPLGELLRNYVPGERIDVYSEFPSMPSFSSDESRRRQEAMRLVGARTEKDWYDWGFQKALRTLWGYVDRRVKTQVERHRTEIQAMGADPEQMKTWYAESDNLDSYCKRTAGDEHCIEPMRALLQQMEQWKQEDGLGVQLTPKNFSAAQFDMLTDAFAARERAFMQGCSAASTDSECRRLWQQSVGRDVVAPFGFSEEDAPKPRKNAIRAGIQMIDTWNTDAYQGWDRYKVGQPDEASPSPKPSQWEQIWTGPSPRRRSDVSPLDFSRLSLLPDSVLPGLLDDDVRSGVYTVSPG